MFFQILSGIAVFTAGTMMVTTVPFTNFGGNVKADARVDASVAAQHDNYGIGAKVSNVAHETAHARETDKDVNVGSTVSGAAHAAIQERDDDDDSSSPTSPVSSSASSANSVSSSASSQNSASVSGSTSADHENDGYGDGQLKHAVNDLLDL